MTPVKMTLLPAKATTVGAMATMLHREVLQRATALKIEAPLTQMTQMVLLLLAGREIAPIKILKELLVTVFGLEAKISLSVGLRRNARANSFTPSSQSNLLFR
jgi:hypothetical protein